MGPLEFLLLLTLLASLAFALIFTSRLTRAVEATADGQLDVPLQDTASDELGRLARAVNRLRHGLQALLSMPCAHHAQGSRPALSWRPSAGARPARDR